MTERLTDAELTFLSEWYRCDEDGMEYYHRAIAELRELRENLAAAELRESVWKAGPDSTFELAQQNAKLVAALETLVQTHPAAHQRRDLLVRRLITAGGEDPAIEALLMGQNALASVKGEQG